MRSDDLRTRLDEIRANEYSVVPDAWALASVMLRPHFIGHADPVLRDHLIYSTLASWIAMGAFTNEQLRTILDAVTDEDHLLFDLENSGDDDTVLTRSFSVLQVAAVLDRHHRHPFLRDSEVVALVPLLARYLEVERDLRGYEPRLGWIHAVAHAADAVANLAQCRELEKEHVLALLRALRTSASRQHHSYTHGEDERLARAMGLAFGRSVLSIEDRLRWLAGYREIVQGCATLGMPEGYTRFMNVKHALRALFFYLRQHQPHDCGDVTEGIESLLEEFSKL